MKPKVYIDGKDGTTGLQIYDRLAARDDIGLLSAALAGGLAAFLIYNFHPAKVFMGDTGSLFLGGMVCGLAFALNMPLIIPVVGLVYVAETLSDIIQVVYFKKTGGKRFFRMASCCSLPPRIRTVGVPQISARSRRLRRDS